MVLFGRMKECIILQKKYSSYIHKNLVICSLWDWRLPFRKGSHWLFGYVPRIKWHPKSVSRRKGLWTWSCQLSYEWRKLYSG